MSPKHFLKAFETRLKRHSKPSKLHTDGTEELHNQLTQDSMSPAPPACVVSVERHDPRPNDERPKETPVPRDLWQAAFSQLEDDKKRLLTTGLPTENVNRDSDAAAPNIEIALDTVIETVQEQYEVRRLKNDNGLYKMAKQIFEAASSLRQSISAVVACDPTGHASTAWSIVSVGLMMTQNYCDQQDQWFESSAFLADTIARITLFQIHYLNKNPNTKEAIEKALLHVYLAVLDYSAEVIRIGQSNVGKRILKSITALNQLPLADIKNAIQNAELRLESLARMQEYLCLDAKADRTLAQGEQVLEKVQNVDDKLVLLNLPVAQRAAFNSHANEPQDYCLQNTRVGLLEEIEDWVNDSRGKSIFWLNGMAGTGKSTISRTVARDLKQRGLLGASFFFNRSERDRASSANLLTTLTKQLTNVLPQFEDAVMKAIRQDPTLVTGSPGDQFNRLLKEPLSTIRMSMGQKLLLIIVIDALDECQDDMNIQIIIERLPELQHTISAVELRFFVTSRPESRILSGFKNIQSGHTAAILHEICQSTVEHDIRVFFQDKLPRITRDRELDETWPGEENIQKLVQMAVPLFIYAATICRAFEDPNWPPESSLEGFLNHPDQQSSQLSRTYLPVLERILAHQSERQVRQLVNEFQNIVGAVIILQDPLPVIPLAELLNTPKATIQTRLNTIQSVIRVPNEKDEPVRHFHQSFRDFLLNTEPDEQTRFSINEAAMNKTVGLHCIRVMERENGGLKRNICSLSSFGTLRKEIDLSAIQCNLPTELQYACRYWANHLQQGHMKLVDKDKILQFLKKHFLHWLEAMGVMGVVTEAVVVVNTLLSIVSGDATSEFSRFLYDAKRFILENGRMIDIAPLQLYCAGLTFAPTKSCIRQIFEAERSKRIHILPQVEHSWSAKLQTLEGHSNIVWSVAFSPDGQIVASSSDDNSVKLWDATTGKERQTIQGHSDWVRSVAFSPDGQTVAFGSDDSSVKLYDVMTGKEKQTLKGHSATVYSIAFSSDRQTIAFNSADNTVKLWDLTTGEDRQTLKGHSGSVNSIAFSQDNQIIISGSDDNTVKLWDTTTGEERQTLRGHSDSVESVTFSPNGQIIASGSRDKTIKLWDAITGKERQTLEDRSGRIWSVAFSPDSQIVATGSDDSTVKLWDTTTGKERQIFEGHFGMIRSVAFSPDGQIVASGADDHTVKLWDATIVKERQTLEGHCCVVQSVAISPDGQTVASGSGQIFGPVDNTIKLWETTTGKERQTLKGHSKPVYSVAFSLDGQTIASSSSDNTVKLWDATTGEERQTLKGHSGSVESVTFSPDGQIIASGSRDYTVKLWDARTGKEQQTLEGHFGIFERSVVFSPDGQIIAFVSEQICRSSTFGPDENSIKLWDAATGKERQTLRGHSDIVLSIAFSLDGQTLASGSRDSTVKLWDTTTGKERQTFRGHSDSVKSVAFSPDGQTVASGSYDQTVKLWDVATGKEWQTLECHSNSVWSVVSPQAALDQPNPQLSLANDWVAFGGERLLWLPSEYRSFSCSATKSDLLVLGYNNGRVIIIGFCQPK